MARFPVVALLGARQVGKTTLAQLKNIFTESKGDWYEL
jgi:predicted AAA+ superfamily ATPase